MENIYNLSKIEEFIKAYNLFNYIHQKGGIIKITECKPTRSNAQNRALHLYFTYCADALNNIGDYFHYRDYNGVDCDIQWSGEMFKTYWIKPIIMVAYGYNSTTQLKTNEIDPLIDVITLRFADKGIRVDFPNSFDFWLKQAGYITK